MINLEACRVSYRQIRGPHRPHPAPGAHRELLVIAVPNVRTLYRGLVRVLKY